MFVAADVTSAEGCKTVADIVRKRLGCIDIVVHVVGGSFAPAGGFAVLDDDVWQTEIKLNLLTAVRLDRALLPAMIAQNSGVIVDVTSIQRQLPLPSRPSRMRQRRRLSRTAARVLLRKLARRGCRLVGWRTTGATALVGRFAADAGSDDQTARQRLMGSLGGIPIGRPAKPNDVADLIAFFVSSRAASITGSEYVIDDGAIPTV